MEIIRYTTSDSPAPLVGVRDEGQVFGLPGVPSLAALWALPLAEIRQRVRDRYAVPAPDITLLPPVDGRTEVWAAGVTYLRSREARLEEARQKTIYEHVYESDRPELFFKAAGWRVVPDGGEVGVREDSTWDVPEPELAVLSNARGEVVAFACGNDMSSRSIEGENPLFLPQAKIYDRSCAIGPAAVLAWDVDVSRAKIRMTIERAGTSVFDGTATVADMTREPAKLATVLHSSYTLPVGAWLLTGASLVPPEPYTAKTGDVVRIAIDGLGELSNRVSLVKHSGAEAKPTRLAKQ